MPLKRLAVPDTALAVAAVNRTFPGPGERSAQMGQGRSHLDGAGYGCWERCVSVLRGSLRLRLGLRGTPGSVCVCLCICVCIPNPTKSDPCVYRRERGRREKRMCLSLAIVKAPFTLSGSLSLSLSVVCILSLCVFAPLLASPSSFVCHLRSRRESQEALATGAHLCLASSLCLPMLPTQGCCPCTPPTPR